MDEDNKFIGLEALTHVAEKVGTNIIMGPAYTSADVLARMRIKVISGVQFKLVETLLVRKGGTSRRKKVGSTLKNSIGFLKERTLVAKLVWNRLWDNISSYCETPFGTDGKPGEDYPLATEAVEAICKTYAEDLTDNLFFGDMSLEDDPEKEALSLYDGFHTYVKHDIEDGVVSVENGNLLLCDAIVAPVDETDSTPYDIVEDLYLRLNPKLRKQKEILCYCDVKRGQYIAQGYANKFRGYSKVVRKDDGTFTIPELPRLVFIPEDTFGVGDRLYFTVPNNFIYGVDNLNNESYVKVTVGSDRDADDVAFQIQSIQGTMVENPLPTHFATTNGSLKENVISGDYQNSKLIVTCDDAEGSVTVDGEAYTEPKEFSVNQVITLVATPKAGYTFAGWSNGSKDATINIVATGMPMAITALFTETAGS